MSRAIYIDTNVFMTAFETADALSESAWAILEAITRGDFGAHTSELTLAELLPRPLRLGSELLVELYMGLISTGGNLTVEAVTRSILIESAEIRAAHPGVRLPDAIHIATASQAGCVAIVSDDRRLRMSISMPLVRLGPDSLDLVEELLG